jgi:O-methyltransferase involved in polyketide biosynthesis
MGLLGVFVTLRTPDVIKEIQETNERILPGLDNSIIARVRFFDDFVESTLAKGLEQLVILGAGYDTRACLNLVVKGW